MNIEKLRTFLGWATIPTEEQKRMEAAIAKMSSEAHAIRVLQKSAGWKLFDEFFAAKRAVLAQELKVCKKEELDKLQLKSQIIDELYNFMNAKVLRDV